MGGLLYNLLLLKILLSHFGRIFFILQQHSSQLHMTVKQSSSRPDCLQLYQMLIVTDRVCWKSDAIGRVRPSARLCSIFWTNWLYNLMFCLCTGHDHSSSGCDSQGHKSCSKVNANSACGILWVLTGGHRGRFPLWRRHQLQTSYGCGMARPCGRCDAAGLTSVINREKFFF